MDTREWIILRSFVIATKLYGVELTKVKHSFILGEVLSNSCDKDDQRTNVLTTGGDQSLRLSVTSVLDDSKTMRGVIIPNEYRLPEVLTTRKCS